MTELTPDTWAAFGSVGTIAAAVIAVGAAAIAVWQAIVARDARNATLEQARVARETLNDERVERYARAAPTFEVTIDPQTQVRQAGARTRMLTGPRRVMVTMKWEINFTWLEAEDTRQEAGETRPTVEVARSGAYQASLCKGATVVVFADEREGATLIRALAQFKITSVDEDNGRTWEDEHMTGWAVESV